MTTKPEQNVWFGRHNHWVKMARCAAYVVGALWMAGGTLFFLVRFGSVFYRANQPAIDKLVGRLTGGG